MPALLPLETATTTAFIVGMLLSGASNTLLTKYQDLACVENCNDPQGRKYFEQPVFQSVFLVNSRVIASINMFLGEFLCLILYYALEWHAKRRRTAYHAVPTEEQEEHDETAILFSPNHTHNVNTENDVDGLLNSTAALVSASGGRQERGIHDSEEDKLVPRDIEGLVQPTQPIHLSGLRTFFLALPTICDLTASTLLNVALLYLDASIFQMLRGAIIFFTASLSVVFLKRRYNSKQWICLLVVVSGVAIVGYNGKSSVADGNEVSPHATLGLFLAMLAQLFTASQFIIEEVLLTKYAITPLKVVGYEGTFGVVLTTVIWIIGCVAIPSHKKIHEFFRPVEALHQFVSIPQITWTAITILFSISCFNFCGLSITRKISSTSRSLIDTCRTVLIWIFALSRGWETFKVGQMVGFVLVVFGTAVFNDVIRVNYGFAKSPVQEAAEEVPVPIANDEKESDEEKEHNE